MNLLHDITILDFTRLLPGPQATQMLADMGATVIKIENPESPDYIRFFPPFYGEQSAYFLALNRSKKSLLINFQQQEGREQIYELVKTADIVFEQYRPGIMAKMGLGYEQLKAINPKLIYVSITGYGQNGPMAMQAGHDLNYLAMSGLLSINGTTERPVIPGMQIADVAGGSYMAIIGALAALQARHTTGKGQHVDISMTDSLMPLATLHYAQYQAEKKVLPREGFELSGSYPNYNVYECADEKWIALGALEPKFWNQFCDLVQQEDWKAAAFFPEDERAAIKKEVAALFKTKTQAEWLQLAEGKDICLTPVLSLDEVAEHENTVARHMTVQQQNGFVSFATPLKFSDAAIKSYGDAPEALK